MQPRWHFSTSINNIFRAEKPSRIDENGVFDDSGAKFTPETADDFYENRQNCRRRSWVHVYRAALCNSVRFLVGIRKTENRRKKRLKMGVFRFLRPLRPIFWGKRFDFVCTGTETFLTQKTASS
jgi:hypothetical protein